MESMEDLPGGVLNKYLEQETLFKKERNQKTKKGRASTCVNKARKRLTNKAKGLIKIKIT